MKILIVGKGGREHALAWKLSQSSHVKALFCAPGNPGTATIQKNENIPIGVSRIEELAGFAQKEGIDLTVVGPEQPLAEGIVDVFTKRSLKIFGPNASAARLESSKKFAKELMQAADVPTAGFDAFRSIERAAKHLESVNYPIVIKADGLAAGKGVSICPDIETAKNALQTMMVDKRFGDSGNEVVIEEFLTGEEASFLILANGTKYLALEGSQDHKRLLEKDEGPNTGGMGAYSPAPVFTKDVQEQVEKEIVQPVLQTLENQGIPFCGVLYLGLMITEAGPKVLEFNVRFGDPEAQAIIPRMDFDLAETLMGIVDNDATAFNQRKWNPESAITLVLAAQGYPQSPRKGDTITGLDEAMKEAIVFHAGTKNESGEILTDGGRVLAVTALGKTLKDASAIAYRAANKIQFDGRYFRKDIGWRALNQEA